ncbi:MAG: redoxin domain-containing protein [Acidobacteriota bacterium]
MACVKILLCLLIAVAACAQTIEIAHPAPDFSADVDWIDQGAHVPHGIKGYRGHVLLVDFWEYTCINCIRDFAVVKRWYAKYHQYGFDVIGVHYGEFAIGHNSDNVRRAAKRLRLPWPVVSDVHGSIWNAYGSQVWPNRYLINQSGTIVMQVEGEGNNVAMEQRIRELLAKDHSEVMKVPLDPPENTFAPQCGRPTDETYVGKWFGRGALENTQGYHQGRTMDFHAGHAPSDGGVILAGKWRTETDGVISEAPNVSANLRYHARSLYAVLSVGNPKKPVRLYLEQEGKPLDKANAGVDVKFDSKGSYVEVSEPRMYYLVNNPQFGSHIIRLTPDARGFDLHSFTYGNNCQQNFDQL